MASARQNIHATTYQVTDLARRHTTVMDAARHGGALIRDKDGTTLLLTPAEGVEATRELAELAGDLIRLERTLRDPGADVVAYGRFAWLALLPAEHRTAFVEESASALLVALSGGPIGPVLELLEDWQATAATWADEELRGELLGDESTPLHATEL